MSSVGDGKLPQTEKVKSKRAASLLAGAQAQLGLFEDQYIEEVITEMEQRSSPNKGDLEKQSSKQGRVLGRKRGRPSNQQLCEEMYNVERIVDKKNVGKKVMYFVKWEGYASDQNTWEPIANLKNVSKMVKRYNRKLA